MITGQPCLHNVLSRIDHFLKIPAVINIITERINEVIYCHDSFKRSV